MSPGDRNKGIKTMAPVQPTFYRRQLLSNRPGEYSIVKAIKSSESDGFDSNQEAMMSRYNKSLHYATLKLSLSLRPMCHILSYMKLLCPGSSKQSSTNNFTCSNFPYSSTPQLSPFYPEIQSNEQGYKTLCPEKHQISHGITGK